MLYVNDMPISRNSKDDLWALKVKMIQNCNMKDLEVMRHILHMCNMLDKKNLNRYSSQGEYISKALEWFHRGEQSLSICHHRFT